MNRVLNLLERWQQAVPVIAFPVAVLRKMQDDRASSLAALVAYYAFFGIFPLLLVLVTVLAIVLKDNQDLQRKILDSAASQIPVIGPQLVASQGAGLQAHGVGLVIGLVGTFIGARGMGGAFRRTCNTAWGVPWQRRTRGIKGFFARLGVIVVVCGGLVATSVVSGLVVSTFSVGFIGRTGGVLLTGLLNVGVFALSFRLCTSTAVPFRNLWVGSVLAAVCWTALQIAGGLVITRSVARASDVYGTFALVIGLLTWLYISAYATIVSLQVDVVRVRRLWPRGFFLRQQLNVADRLALTSYVEAEQRVPTQRITVTYDP